MIDFAMWVQIVEVPVILGLFGYALKTKSDLYSALTDIKDDHAKFQIEVAKTYMTGGALREVKVEIMAHLNRIERKIDSGHSERG